jgi:hypothetical protein
MRATVIAIAMMLLLTACASSQKYTQQDLQQVNHAFSVLRPIYLDFRAAFFRYDFVQMTRYFVARRPACREVDAIDRRDTIDPNTDLFQLSAGLDGMCNDIESVYAAWEKAHHMKYDKSIVPSFLSQAFNGSDRGLRIMAQFQRHPADYTTAATPGPTPPGK